MRRLVANERLDGIPGRTWNRFVDAAEHVERLRSRRVGEFPRHGGAASQLVIPMRNATGAALGESAIVSLGSVELSPENDATATGAIPRLAAITPTYDARFRFGVVAEPAGIGEDDVPVIVRGVAWARVNVITGGDKICGVVPGDRTALESGIPGATILWAELQDAQYPIGVQWCCISLDGIGDASACLVQPISQVLPQHPTFTANVVEQVHGYEWRDEVTVLNSYAETIPAFTDLVAWRRESDARYRLARPGQGGGGVQVWRITLSQDLPLLSDEAQATITGAGTPIIAIDPYHDFAAKSGYTGFALKYTDDHNETGKPGAHIIAMQTPMRFVAAKVSGSYSQAGTPVVLFDEANQYGHPFEGKQVALTQAFDPYSLAANVKINDPWMLIYSEVDDRYDFAWPLVPPVKTMLRVKGVTQTSVARNDVTVTLGSLQLVGGTLPYGVALPATIAANVPDYARMNCGTAGKTVYALMDLSVGTTIADQWTAADAANWHWIARGRVGWRSDRRLTLESEGAEESSILWRERLQLQPARLITAMLPAANLTGGDTTIDAGASTAEAKPMQIDVATGDYVETGVTLPARNLTRGAIYPTNAQQKIVYGFIEEGRFYVTDTLRGSVVTGTTAGTVTTQTTSFTVQSVTEEIGWNPGASITAQNRYKFAIASGKKVRCELSDNGDWVCTQAEC